ncbi:Phage integrase, N-terminal SAM-like domain [Bacillus sp. OV194]|nr:Phage integrase, N-terminal SAM-like domain [Bacillus sp. OV194]
MSVNIEMAQKEYLAEKKYQGLTENSLRSYNDFFKLWNEWLTEQGLQRFDQLNNRNTKAFLIWCTNERGNKPKTVNTKLKLLRALARMAP